ncbi:MAG: hydrolase, partial [Lentisphaerae bacterium]|nr:hydrolase [Lentisphaerota bacterium]
TSNRAQFAIYKKLIKAGAKNLFYMKDDDLIGSDGEGTVDSVHLTDLGYMRFSEKMIPLLQKLGN